MNGWEQVIYIHKLAVLCFSLLILCNNKFWLSAVKNYEKPVAVSLGYVYVLLILSNR